MNISELERLTGITKQNIRFYEKKGLMRPMRNSMNNYREYTQEDVEILKMIKLFRKLDMPLEEIHKILSEEVSLPTALAQHIETLQTKEQELSACIYVCKELLRTELKTLDVDETFEKMSTIEKNGGKFMSIIEDYKRFSTAEQGKSFSFTPETMIQNPTEFTEALLWYAQENNLYITITKEGMHPVFEIDGREYTAYRSFGRFGATVRCTLTHPEEYEVKGISSNRKAVYRFVRGPYLFLLCLLIVMAVSRQSLQAALLVAVMIFPYLCWVFIRTK